MQALAQRDCIQGAAGERCAQIGRSPVADLWRARRTQRTAPGEARRIFERNFDRALVRRCVDGDAQAWRLLHRRYRSSVFGFLRRLGVSREDLEDVCQEVFLRCSVALGTYRGEAELGTWLYKLCRTEARTARRRKRVAQSIRGLLLIESEQRTVVWPDAGPGATGQLVRGALGALSDRDRTVLQMFAFEGVSGKEIAHRLGCPLGTVWRSLHYTRRAIRGSLQEAAT